VIVEMDRSHVSGGLDAEEKLRKAGGKAPLVIQRDKGSFFIALERSEN
jgi:hypothetical protein